MVRASRNILGLVGFPGPGHTLVPLGLPQPPLSGASTHFPPHPIPGWRWTSCSFGYWAAICGWGDQPSWARWTCGTAGTRGHPLLPGRAQQAGQTAQSRAVRARQILQQASPNTQRAITTRRHRPKRPQVSQRPAQCAVLCPATAQMCHIQLCPCLLLPPGKTKCKPRALSQMCSRAL